MEPFSARFEYSLSVYLHRKISACDWFHEQGLFRNRTVPRLCNLNNDLAVKLTYNIIRCNFFVMVYFCVAGGGVVVGVVFVKYVVLVRYDIPTILHTDNPL